MHDVSNQLPTEFKMVKVCVALLWQESEKKIKLDNFVLSFKNVKFVRFPTI